MGDAGSRAVAFDRNEVDAGGVLFEVPALQPSLNHVHHFGQLEGRNGFFGGAEAVAAPRMHFEDGIVYHEPGIDMTPVRALHPEREVVRFHAPNLFFGGVQAVHSSGGRLTGAGDPRRGGVAVSA